MNKVLLISPLSMHPRYPLYMPSENLGIAYIASFLRSKNVEVDILDMNMLEIPAQRIIELIDLNNYILIGISSSSYLLIDETIAISKEIKKISPIHVTVGGHFATFAHQKILNSTTTIDSVVRGEGEETSFELYDRLINHNQLDFVKGLSWKSSDNEIIINSPRNLVDDLNSLPWPARDTLKYLVSLNHSWPTQLTTSRGCYANCSFCDIRAFSGTRWRSRAAKDIVDEIEFLKNKYNSKLFRFTDDEFIGPKPAGPLRALEIANELISRNLGVELMIDARAHMVTKELFSKLKQAGVVDCLIGIESGVDRILKLYNKGIKVETNIRAIHILKELNMSLNLAFIMFDPRMTFEELIMNYEFLKTHKIVTVDSLKSWIWPLDGTPLRDTLVNEGYATINNFCDVTYNFADKKVGNVFDSINKCSEITFELELQIFKAKKNNSLTKQSFQLINKLNLNLWIKIFDNLLKRGEVDYGLVNGEVESIKLKIIGGSLL